MKSSGFSIIRWQSSGNSVTLRSDLTTGGPIVRLGTKCPSIMSTWMTLAPPSPAAHTCSPSRAKSAERMDGASSINPGPQNLARMQLLQILTRGTAVPGGKTELEFESQFCEDVSFSGLVGEVF